MRIKCFAAAGVSLCLCACSGGQSSLQQAYTDPYDQQDLNADVGKEQRLGSYAKDQVILLDDSSYPVEDVTAESALLFTLDEENTVILCKNAYGTFQPGNITKLIACEYIMKNYDYYSEVMIDSQIFSVDTALWSCHFTKGDSVKMKDLITAALMYCANDVMIPLYMYTAGDASYMASELNTYMEELGAENTNIISCFSEDVSGQQTTIFDLYMFFSEALRDENITDILSLKTYNCEYTNNEAKQSVVLTNYLPYFYQGVTTSSGLTVTGGMCEPEEMTPTQMLTIAEDSDGTKYVAFVAGCEGYADCLSQTEEILSKIFN